MALEHPSLTLRNTLCLRHGKKSESPIVRVTLSCQYFSSWENVWSPSFTIISHPYQVSAGDIKVTKQSKWNMSEALLASRLSYCETCWTHCIMLAPGEWGRSRAQASLLISARRGGVNHGITVSNVKGIYCGVRRRRGGAGRGGRRCRESGWFVGRKLFVHQTLDMFSGLKFQLYRIKKQCCFKIDIILYFGVYPSWICKGFLVILSLQRSLKSFN